MNDVITLGEAMIVFNPNSTGPLKYVNNFEKSVGGAELNFAIGCARLGLSVGWISRLGNDEFGKHIQTFVRGEGIDVSEVKFVDDYPTSLNFKEIMEDGSGRTFYYRDKSPILQMNPEDLNEDYFKEAKIFHLTGVFLAIDKKNIEIANKAISLAKKHNVTVSFDPNIRLRMWSKEEARDIIHQILPHVDILLASDEEMDIVLGESEPEKIADKLGDFNISHIAIKQGEKGAVGFYKDEKIVSKAVPAIKVVDTVGAGDGFNAGFIYGILQGWSLERTLSFSNAIGSMVVRVVGDNDGLPYYEDVLGYLGEIERIER